MNSMVWSDKSCTKLTFSPGIRLPVNYNVIDRVTTVNIWTESKFFTARITSDHRFPDLLFCPLSEIVIVSFDFPQCPKIERSGGERNVDMHRSLPFLNSICNLKELWSKSSTLDHKASKASSICNRHSEIKRKKIFRI